MFTQPERSISLIFTVSEIATLLLSKLLRPALFGKPLLIEVIATGVKHLLFKVLSSTRIAELQARAVKGVLSPLSTCPSNQVLDNFFADGLGGFLRGIDNNCCGRIRHVCSTVSLARDLGGFYFSPTLADQLSRCNAALSTINKVRTLKFTCSYV